MREIKIFLVVVVFTALVYWGVEPYAHSVMKPHVAPANFNFAVEDTTFAKGIVEAKELALKDAQASGDAKRIESANKELEKAKEELSKVETLWQMLQRSILLRVMQKKVKNFLKITVLHVMV